MISKLIKSQLIVALVTISIISSVHASKYGDLQNYEKLNPHAELKVAIKNKDLRFIALGGYGVYVPGVEDYYENYKDYGHKVIEGTSDLIIDYEHGRLTEIARYYAHTYNTTLMRHISEMDSWEMARSLKGYNKIASKYTIQKVMKGHINMLPYSLHPSLVNNNARCVKRAWWFNPIENDAPKYNWLEFERVNLEVEEVVCNHSWIEEWVNSGIKRSAESQIFGLQPNTETKIDYFVGTAWDDAGLDSMPYYEVNLREGTKWVGTVFIGKDKTNALITTSQILETSHWLDQFEFSYHPKATNIEYITVTKEGRWNKVNKPQHDKGG